MPKISEKIVEHFKLMPSINLLNLEKSTKTLEILLMVKRSWIEIFIQGTNERFGSVESYLKDEIKLDMERFKKVYLDLKGV